MIGKPKRARRQEKICKTTPLRYYSILAETSAVYIFGEIALNRFRRPATGARRHRRFRHVSGCDFHNGGSARLHEALGASMVVVPACLGFFTLLSFSFAVAGSDVEDAFQKQARGGLFGGLAVGGGHLRLSLPARFFRDFLTSYSTISSVL